MRSTASKLVEFLTLSRVREKGILDVRLADHDRKYILVDV